MMKRESPRTTPSSTTYGIFFLGAFRGSPSFVSYGMPAIRMYVSSFTTNGLRSGRPQAGPNLWTV